MAGVCLILVPCLSSKCRSKSMNLNDNQKTTYCDLNCYLYRQIVGVDFIKRWLWHQCHTGGSEILLTLPCLAGIMMSYRDKAILCIERTVFAVGSSDECV